MSVYEQIRRMREDGKSIRAIAKYCNVSRQTVRKYCAGETFPGVRKEYHRDPPVLTQDVIDFVRSCLETDQTEKLHKQRHTSKRIYDRLCEEMDFTGSYSAVRNLVCELKADYTPPSGDIPLVHAPGDAAQVDFGECTVYLKGVRTKIPYFCGRLCYSCAPFVYACATQGTESFVEAVQRMFQYFGGVPHRVVFDNGSCAVKSGHGRKAVATDSYKGLAAHYVFETVFCNVASGNEKGLVENLVGYARRNFMVPIPRVESIEEFNELLRERCDRYIETHKVESRTESVHDALILEKQVLKPMASYWLDTSKSAECKVSDYSLVHFDKNSYSVPFRYVKKSVTVKGYAAEIRIFAENKQIAVHERAVGQKNTKYVLDHYIHELKKKPRSVFQAQPVLQTIQEELLEIGKRLPNKERDMVILLSMVVQYKQDAVLAAIRRASELGILTVDSIRAQLESVETTTSNESIAEDIEVYQPDPSVFDDTWGLRS